MNAGRWVQAGLALFAVVETALGLWTSVLPRRFYDLVPGVDMLPYNEHLLRDYGGMNLALALVFWVALAHSSEVWWARTAFGAYLLFAVPHLAYHMAHLDGLNRSELLFTVISLPLAVLIPALLLALTWVAPATTRSNGSRSTRSALSCRPG
jgi:hypothetical protein